MDNIPPDKNRHVLVIDDNYAVHDDFRKILSPVTRTTTALDATEAALFGHSTNALPESQTKLTKFEVDSAHQGQEGVMLAAKALQAGQPYALAFVDVRMPPGWDGVETTRKIWEIDPDVQIVICTAYSDYSWGEMFAQLGQRDGLLILKKPFDAVEAFQLAHALTEKWSLHQQSRQKMEDLERRVTERTQELAKSLSLLNATFESTADGIVVVDLATKVVSYNTRFADIWQFPAEMLARRDANEMRAHAAKQVKDPERFLRRIQEIQAVPEIEGFDVIELKDGRIFERYVFPQRINRECVGSVINWRDITERKQSEKALQESNERFHQFAESITDAFWICSADMREVDYVSPAFERIWGRSLESLSANPWQWMDFVVSEDRERVQRAFAELTDDDSTLDLEYRIFRPDGAIRWLRVRVFKVRDPEGKLIRSTGIVSDITDQKLFEARLLESQKLETVGKLAGGVAHEFNSIMTAIIGQCELLLTDLPPGNPLCHNATEIHTAADRAATLTRQLLAYGRKQLLQPVTLDLNAILSGMQSTVRHLMGPDVDVRLVPAGALQSIRADAGQIEQVIMNMILNARDAMPRGGELLLETANVSLDEGSVDNFPELKPGDYVMLAITDTGAGMSGEVKAHLFEPFFTTKGVGQGTGLGLSTCYGIIRQSGGHISVDSEPGQGATFRIYLPQVEAVPETPLPRLDSPNLPRGVETILLVEDDTALLEMSATFLRRLGYTVFASANGLEALNLKQQSDSRQIDLLIADVTLPHMSGRDLADGARKLHPNIRVLFTSTHAENTPIHQSLLGDGAALLQRPFTPSALAQKVRDVLDEIR